MCRHGTTVEMVIRDKPVRIDKCISRIVAALNAGGVPTKASCCGHGQLWGRITLDDGRELMVCPDYERATAFTKVFGRNIHGEQK